MLTSRQNNLLKIIVQEYITTAQPVGSELLVEKYKLDVSSATVRNEMLELDRAGYLEQPYTSAGRIPTSSAYQHYIAYEFQPKPPTPKEQQKINQIMKAGQSSDRRTAVKELSKTLSDLSGQFVLTAFADNDFYYTGLSNLFSHPEFAAQNIICNLSQVIDHLDRRLAKLFYQVNDQLRVFVGKDNPIDACLSLLAIKPDNELLLAILGPMRMKYEVNVGLLEYCKNI